MAAADPDWWKRAVFYQVAPRSFQDSDGDGVGDLGGILRRLDHLAWLGVDAVWLCPILPTLRPNEGVALELWPPADVSNGRHGRAPSRPPMNTSSSGVHGSAGRARR